MFHMAKIKVQNTSTKQVAAYAVAAVAPKTTRVCTQRKGRFQGAQRCRAQWV